MIYDYFDDQIVFDEIQNKIFIFVVQKFHIDLSDYFNRKINKKRCSYRIQKEKNAPLSEMLPKFVGKTIK